ncbi:MAG: phosphodiesterase [Gammaproteobacteria bacterium]|nr:phosphodiesterase [Gammaproteobacteria bacterium]MCP5425767.1 phosphodiesterase [Gammaproteobacteria bacterium]MCP5458622.1 phosphodiesterase [Gammaproteobacteria bacterium]
MKLIHFTDTHLVGHGQKLYGLDPLARLTACIADINRHHADAELCVITGDLTHWGECAAYRNLRDCLAELTVPLRLVIGNHDDRTELRLMFPDTAVDEYGFIQSGMDTEIGRLLFLDTIEEETHAGRYCLRRLEWLSDALNTAADQPVYLFMHHPPFPVGLPSLDALGIPPDQAHALNDLLEAHGDVRHIFFGHVHRPISGQWRGISFSTLRGTNHQISLDFQAIDDVPGSHEPPAYTVVLVDADRIVVHYHDFLDASPQFSLGSTDWDSWNQERDTRPIIA